MKEASPTCGSARQFYRKLIFYANYTYNARKILGQKKGKKGVLPGEGIVNDGKVSQEFGL